MQNNTHSYGYFRVALHSHLSYHDAAFSLVSFKLLSSLLTVFTVNGRLMVVLLNMFILLLIDAVSYDVVHSCGNIFYLGVLGGGA